MADSSAGTYYKVPSQWHQISKKDLDAAISAGGGSTAGIWSTAFDASPRPSFDHNNSVALDRPFVFAVVGALSSAGSNRLSYDAMRDIWLPVTSQTRQQD
ncbi:MAG: hypothetical protein ACRDNS_22700, partial [Trebonia sp.]